MTPTRNIRSGREGEVGLLVLARADGLNSLDPEMMAELCEAIDRMNADPAVRAIVLTAEGRHFCAGADFAFLEKFAGGGGAEVRDQLYAHFQGAVRRIFRSPKPTLAAVDGAAVTVGSELALACDFRIVGPRARFQQSWIRLGLVPPLGGTWLLPRMIGIARANEMILRGRPVEAEEAVRIGLASELVASEALRARAIEMAAELAALPPRAYAQAKEAIQRGLESTLDREWSAGVLTQAMLLGTEDFREGLAAVREKRQGRFTGR